jgi:DNA-binding Lrp family transcriptional regulator
MTMLDAIDEALIDSFQRDFPLFSMPFQHVGAEIGVSAEAALLRVRRLVETGVLSRLGAVLRPNRVGASTLAAIAAPQERLEAVAELVNAEPGVNHNYEREHAINLWFVVTGPTQDAVTATLSRIQHRTGLPVLDFPMLRSFHIDLGFPIFDGPCKARVAAPLVEASASPDDLLLLTAIEDGLPLTQRPFWQVAQWLDWSETRVLSRLDALLRAGLIVRFGLVVKHRALGFHANAMLVWDIDDEALVETAVSLAAEPSITLCYQRPRRPPAWRYNLYSMIHGRDREIVLTEVDALVAKVGSSARDMAILFSRRCFRQRGARLSAA